MQAMKPRWMFFSIGWLAGGVVAFTTAKTGLQTILFGNPIFHETNPAVVKFLAGFGSLLGNR